jgi:hypothetical protein
MSETIRDVWLAAAAAISALLALSGCNASDYSIPLPVEVVIADFDITPQEFAMWQQGGREWNAMVPGVIADVNLKSKRGGCGRVFVIRRAADECAQGRDAVTILDGYGCDAEVQICVLDDARYAEAIRHELAHVFTAGGDEWDMADGIPAELAAIVSARMGGDL